MLPSLTRLPPTGGLFRDSSSSDVDWSREEALDFLERVEKKIDQPIDRTLRNNVAHYLTGDYQPKHHVSMFGTDDTFAHDGVGIFWENVLEGFGIRQGSLWYKDSIRFANNDGANFRDHRKEALEMFREAYERLKKNPS